MTTIDPSTLIETFRREGLSLLQYIRQTSPYASRADRPLVAKILDFAVSEGKLLELIANELADARLTVPSLGGFPSEHANFNYFDVRKLLPYLIEDHERLIGRLRNEMEEREVDGVRFELFGLKEVHLAEMKTLLAAMLKGPSV